MHTRVQDYERKYIKQASSTSGMPICKEKGSFCKSYSIGPDLAKRGKVNWESVMSARKTLPVVRRGCTWARTSPFQMCHLPHPEGNNKVGRGWWFLSKYDELIWKEKPSKLNLNQANFKFWVALCLFTACSPPLSLLFRMQQRTGANIFYPWLEFKHL